MLVVEELEFRTEGVYAPLQRKRAVHREDLVLIAAVVSFEGKVASVAVRELVVDLH